MNAEPLRDEDAVQRAVASRLGKLRSFPVDTSRVDRVMRRQIPPVAARKRWRWMGQLSAAAASILIIVSLMFVMLPGRAVQASASEMAQMHYDIVSGKVPTMKADSIQEANEAIAAMAGNSVRLPDSPSAHTMSCCMRDIGNKKVACVLLEDGGAAVTMSVAQAKDMKPSAAPAQIYNGITYHVTSIGKLNMVTVERGGKWICLMSETKAERLMQLADRLKL